MNWCVQSEVPFAGYLALKDSVVRFELDPKKNKEVGRFSLLVVF